MLEGGGGVLEGKEVLATSCHYTHHARCHSCLGQQSVKLSKSGNCSLAIPAGRAVALFIFFSSSYFTALFSGMITIPGIARAVLQTALLLFNSVTQTVILCENIF